MTLKEELRHLKDLVQQYQVLSEQHGSDKPQGETVDVLDAAVDTVIEHQIRLIMNLTEEVLTPPTIQLIRRQTTEFQKRIDEFNDMS